MKARLLNRERDIDLKWPLAWNDQALTQDLALDTLFKTMAQGDEFVLQIVRKVLLSGFGNDIETILYRQSILKDSLAHAAVVHELYAIAVEAMEKERSFYFGSLMRHPDWALRQSTELLATLIDPLKKLRRLADRHADRFTSEGWRTFFATLQKELADDYFTTVQAHLARLKFPAGVLLSARLGEGNKGTNYVLRQQAGQGAWFTRIFAPRMKGFSFSLNPRDDSGFKALAEIRDRGIARVANAVSQSADHVRNYFKMLRSELAFYIGCLNLHERLIEKGECACFPMPVAGDECSMSFRGLYDVCLSLNLDHKVVGNDVDAERKQLLIITGANQGGKSTVLRGIGLAQLMMQSGMFVAAEAFCSSLRDGLFTHYKREEDIGLKSGKLDEELARMSAIVDHVTSRPMILFNESFAATNEREGSEIARQIVTALLERKARMVFVTHLYELARVFYEENKGDVLFLRAERQTDGTRTFKLVEAPPLETSFGEDLYRNIFVGGAAGAEAASGTGRPASRCRALCAKEPSHEADFLNERRGR